MTVRPPRPRNLHRAAAAAIGIAAITLAALIGLYLDSRPPVPAEPISVAYSPFESTALFWIADEQHYFEERGFDLTLRGYDSGAASLDGVIDGEADIVVGVSEFPLVEKAFQGAPVRTMGTIDKGNFVYIVARRDRGIGNASDLEGKRIGTTVGTASEFHLGRFLELNGMTMQEITLVDVGTPEGWVNAVADGEIDAVSTAQPYANAARERLGENAVVWPAQSGQPVFSLVVATDAWIAEHPGQAERFLESLARAEDYAAEHPAESRAIVQRRLNLDPAYMDTVWQQNRFALSLDQSLVTAMEDEARWMIANNRTTATAVPHFRNHLYTAGLERVDPGSVNIVG